MSAADTGPRQEGRDIDAVAEELVRRLVNLFGITDTRRILFKALTIAKHEYAEDGS